MRYPIALWVSVAISLAAASRSPADTVFDTNTVTPATQSNYWPWGDANNTRYQLWISKSSLSGITGVLDSITQFANNETNLGAVYSLDVYASTTSVASGALSSSNLDGNDGANKTLVFSGNKTFDSSTFTIDVNHNFIYDGSGNLLLDFIFHSYTGVARTYDGPLFQAMESNPDFFRVTSNNLEGNAVWDWGTLRTQLDFEPAASTVPEPASITLVGACVVSLCGYGWRRRKVAITAV